MKKIKFKPMILDGVLINDYLVSDAGDVYKIDKKKGTKGIKTMVKARNLCSLNPNRHKNDYLYVTVSFSTDLFKYKYCQRGCGKNFSKRTLRIHQVIMQTFKPFDEFLPKEINKKDYAKTPESMKMLIKQAFVVNHIDHNKNNNSISNLEWVTNKTNHSKALKHYRGNFHNKPKRVLTR